MKQIPEERISSSQDRRQIAIRKQWGVNPEGYRGLDGSAGLTAACAARLARDIYRDAKPDIKYKQGLRPYICPFHLLVDYIPNGASVLDAGCGAGLFILLMAKLGRIRSAVGFDSDYVAIRAAQNAAAKLMDRTPIHFEQISADDRWPKGRFDVVSIIDVMHHVHPEKQAELIASAAEHLNDGGLLVYKDMAKRPVWRAAANRLHDLVSVHEWIHYAALDDVIDWAKDAGLNLEHRLGINVLWYGHECCLFRNGPLRERYNSVPRAS
jgi:2-polyprenyl-3-methyl-5-hydroxy-6-metoxy-1,4-benzoquinol methylase